MKSSSAGWVVVVMMMTMTMIELGRGESTVEECNSTIAAMQGCLPYATGKAATPTADCCKVVNTTVQHNKDCLCKFIALVHQGNPEITSLGVQEAKLVQLPTACKLNNVSASNCPKLSPTSAPVAGNVNTTTTAAGYKLLHLPLQFQPAFIFLAIMPFL